MSALGRGYLAAVLATAMAVVPSRAAEATIAPTPSKLTQPDKKPDVLTQAENEAETYPGIVIAIAKGQKETQLTGEQIGDKLVEVLRKSNGVPAKYLVAPGGDYTAVAFMVRGHAYGPYSLKTCLIGSSIAAIDYDRQVRLGLIPPESPASRPAASSNGLAAKPEPQQP